MAAYTPNPINLSDIELDNRLQEDIEAISKNIHDTWAKQRMLGGWGYGDIYDQLEKKHPCLIAYEQLPEVEKDMDRATVTQTIKMLIHLGYTIEKK